MRSALFLLLTVLPLAAQSTQTETKVMPLSLRQAVDLALAPTGGLRLQLASELIRQADAQRAFARGVFLPSVDAAYTVRSFTQNLEAFGIQISSRGGPFAIPHFVGPIDTYDARASATWSAFDLSGWTRYKAAGSRLKAATLDEQAQRNLTAAAVINAYTAAQRARQLVTTAQANVALAERLLRLAESQKSAGTGTGIDIVRAQTQIASERQRLIASEEDRNAADLQLMRAMNVPLDARLELTDELQYKPVEETPVAAALDVARQERPELKAQSARGTAAKLSYDAAKYERLPSVQAFGDYGVIGTSPSAGLPTRSVGVKVNIPIYDGGGRDAGRAESASLMRQEQIRTRDVEQQVDLEVRTSLDALRSAEQQVRAAMETLALSEKELEQAQRRYEAGVAFSLEITEAQTRVSRAREQNVNALFRHRAARVNYGIATGTIEQVLD